MKVVRSSSFGTGCLYPHEFSWYSFLDAESTPGHMVPSVASEKIPSDATGDRSRDPPTSSAVICWTVDNEILRYCLHEQLPLCTTWWSVCALPVFLNMGGTRKRLATFMFRPLYLRGKAPGVSLKRTRRGGGGGGRSQGRSQVFEERKINCVFFVL
jgi:hypothetical protein